MRTAYEPPLRSLRVARAVDVLLLAIGTLSVVAFLAAPVVIHRLDSLTHISAFLYLPVRLHNAPGSVSLQAVFDAGLVVSGAYVASLVTTRLPALVKRGLF